MSCLLAWNSWLVGGFTVLFLVVCVMMILTVLIQRPQGGGLSGAFGSGAGSGQTAFGAKTGDALTIFTIIVFVLFLGLGITLNFGYRPDKAGEGEVRILDTKGTAPDGSSVNISPEPTPSDGAPPAAPAADPAAPSSPPAPGSGPGTTPAVPPPAAPAPTDGAPKPEPAPAGPR